MNSFLYSLAFITISYLLGAIKHMVFPQLHRNQNPSNPTLSKQISFVKIFELSPANQSIVLPRPSYNSLYQAYLGNKQEQFVTNNKDNTSDSFHHKFNHSVLEESLEDEKQEFICGSQFMLMIWRGIRTNRINQADRINFIEVYRLPTFQKLDMLTIFGRIRLPKQCKKHRQFANKYQFGIVNQNRPALLVINENGKVNVHMNLMQYFDEYFLEILMFDYTIQYWAYTTRDEPWIIRVAQKKFENQAEEFASWVMKKSNNSKTNSNRGIYETNTFLEINLLNIELIKSQQWETNQVLTIQHIFLRNLSSLYLTCVYDYYNTKSKIKKIVQASFKIDKQNLVLLSHINLFFERTDGNQIQTQCTQFLAPQKISDTTTNDESYDLSCLIYKKNQKFVEYVTAKDVFKLKGDQYYMRQNWRKNNPNSQNVFESSQYSSWMPDLDTIEEQTNQDLIFMMRKMTPLVKVQQKKVKSIRPPILSYKFSTSMSHYTEIKLLKPSLPDPIIFLSTGEQHYLFTFTIINYEQILMSKNIRLTNIPSSNSRISIISAMRELSRYTDDNDEPSKPYQMGKTKQHSQQLGSSIRTIKYSEEYFKSRRDDNQDKNFTNQEHLEKVVIIFWGNSIQVYQYLHSQSIEIFPQNQDYGIPMAAVFPFIQLFATTFCVFQTICGTIS